MIIYIVGIIDLKQHIWAQDKPLIRQPENNAWRIQTNDNEITVPVVLHCRNFKFLYSVGANMI